MFQTHRTWIPSAAFNRIQNTVPTQRALYPSAILPYYSLLLKVDARASFLLSVPHFLSLKSVQKLAPARPVRCIGLAYGFPMRQHICEPVAQLSKAASHKTQAAKRTGFCRGPKDHINIRILQSMFSRIPLILGLTARTQDPHICNYICNPVSIYICYIHVCTYMYICLRMYLQPQGGSCRRS